LDACDEEHGLLLAQSAGPLRGQQEFVPCPTAFVEFVAAFLRKVSLLTDGLDRQEDSSWNLRILLILSDPSGRAHDAGSVVFLRSSVPQQ
jgi:hypothetical protein